MHSPGFFSIRRSTIPHPAPIPSTRARSPTHSPNRTFTLPCWLRMGLRNLHPPHARAPARTAAAAITPIQGRRHRRLRLSARVPSHRHFHSEACARCHRRRAYRVARRACRRLPSHARSPIRLPSPTPGSSDPSRLPQGVPGGHAIETRSLLRHPSRPRQTRGPDLARRHTIKEIATAKIRRAIRRATASGAPERRKIRVASASRTRSGVVANTTALGETPDPLANSKVWWKRRMTVNSVWWP